MCEWGHASLADEFLFACVVRTMHACSGWSCIEEFVWKKIWWYESTGKSWLRQLLLLLPSKHKTYTIKTFSLPKLTMYFTCKSFNNFAFINLHEVEFEKLEQLQRCIDSTVPPSTPPAQREITEILWENGKMVRLCFDTNTLAQNVFLISPHIHTSMVCGGSAERVYLLRVATAPHAPVDVLTRRKEKREQQQKSKWNKTKRILELAWCSNAIYLLCRYRR